LEVIIECLFYWETVKLIASGTLIGAWVGPSGCGKTSLVHRVVANCGAVLVVVQGPEVYCPQPGDTEGWLRSVFEEAACLAQEGECMCVCVCVCVCV